jgi:hypothetical protein
VYDGEHFAEAPVCLLSRNHAVQTSSLPQLAKPVSPENPPDEIGMALFLIQTVLISPPETAPYPIPHRRYDVVWTCLPCGI